MGMAPREHLLVCELWVKAYAAEIKRLCPDLSKDQAKGYAESSFENLKHDFYECPIDAAHEDLTCFTD